MDSETRQLFDPFCVFVLWSKCLICRAVASARTSGSSLNGPRQAKNVPSNMRKMCWLISSCASAKYHPGLCSPFIDSVVSQWFCQRTVKALTRLCGRAGWSGDLLFLQARRHIFFFFGMARPSWSIVYNSLYSVVACTISSFSLSRTSLRTQFIILFIFFYLFIYFF